jgi:hypothetical protein
MPAENDAFFAKLIRRANEHDTRWREAERRMFEQFDKKSDNGMVQDLIDDKFAQEALLTAKRNQIQALTTIIRALGHYTPGERFHTA